MKGMLGIIQFKSAWRSREGTKLTGSTWDGQKLRVARNEYTLGTVLQGPKHCSLLPPEPLGIISWLLLLVARAEESLWGF